MRKYCKVPKGDVLLIKQMGIDSLGALGEIHFTKVPQLWKRIHALGGTQIGEHVKMVVTFCYWYQEVHKQEVYMRDTECDPAPKMNDGIVDQFAQFVKRRVEVEGTTPFRGNPTFAELQKDHKWTKNFLLNSVYRRICSDLHGTGKQYQYREAHDWDFKDEGYKKMAKAAPAILFGQLPATKGKDMPRFHESPPSDEEINEALDLMATYVVNDGQDGQPPEGSEVEDEDEQLARENQELRELWATAVITTQQSDKKSDLPQGDDLAGEDTDHEDADRIRDYQAQKALWATESRKRKAKRWLEGDLKQKQRVLRKLSESPDEQEMILGIKEIYQATVRREFQPKILSALVGLDDTSQQKTIVREFYQEMVGGNDDHPSETGGSPKLDDKES